VALPSGISKSQIQRLGKRIAAQQGPLDPADQSMLGVFLDHCSSALQVVHGTVEPLVEGYGSGRGFELRATARLKNRETIREKIRRDHTNLVRMEDVVGVRVVDIGGSMTPYDQDEVCERILGALGPDALRPRLIDRRAEPKAGYRALHMVVEWNDVPIEIQVRTALQDAWAQVFEGLADSWGREIRYGRALRDPDAPALITPGTRQEAIDQMLTLSEYIAEFEKADCQIQELDLLAAGDILMTEELEVLVADVRSQQRRVRERIRRILQDMIAFQESEAW
jgi:ppGpp synthetase/RelA/SpoT-type nucleotidyltranferase